MFDLAGFVCEEMVRFMNSRQLTKWTGQRGSKILKKYRQTRTETTTLHCFITTQTVSMTRSKGDSRKDASPLRCSSLLIVKVAKRKQHCSGRIALIDSLDSVGS